MIYSTIANVIDPLSFYLGLVIQNQNLQDYWQSYLIILLGGILILTGLFWLIRFNKFEKQEHKVALFSELNQQIDEISKVGADPNAYQNLPGNQKPIPAPVINESGVYEQGNTSTEILIVDPDETQLFEEVLPMKMNEKGTNLDETTALNIEG